MAILCIVSAAPLVRLFAIPGTIIWGVVAITTVYFAYKVEKTKKEQDIQTYKEIVTFINGQKLDTIEKAIEEGKRNYQK